MDPRIQARYAQLCQELGHLICNLEALQAKIANVKTEIAGLNAAAPIVAPKKEPKND